MRVLVQVLILQCSLLLLACNVNAQDPLTAHPTSAAVVKIPLIVVERDQRSVDQFAKEELKIADGNKEAALTVENDERPIDYGLVVDSSGSLRSMYPAVLATARAIVTTKRDTDRVFLERFISSDKIRIVQDFTSNTSVLVASINRFVVEGGQSAVLDGIYAGIDYLAKHSSEDTSRRKALVLITDGEDRNSYYKIDQVTKLLRESGVQVFIIGLTTELDNDSGLIRKSSRDKAEILLKKIAQESGGRLFLPKNVKGLNTALEQITHDLQTQFLITYRPDEPLKQGFREVKAKLSPNSRKLTAITPPGYFIATSTPQQRK